MTNKNSTAQINNDIKLVVSQQVKDDIFHQVEQHYKEDIQEMIFGKKCWRQIGITFETMSKITVAVGGLLSFSSGYFNSNMLSFISGSISMISLALLQFGSFGFKQAKKRGNDLNILLKKLNMETVPVINGDINELLTGHNKTLSFNTDITNISVDTAEEKNKSVPFDGEKNNIELVNIELGNTISKTK
jgi:hypothetical protein